MTEIADGDIAYIRTTLTLTSRRPWSMESYSDDGILKYRVFSAYGMLVCDDCTLYDAEFIVDASDNIGMLLDEVEMLRDELNDLRNGIESLL